MTPRLKLLWELLADDGVIFVSLDDNELYNSKILLNEIFDEKNFVQNFMWLHGKGKKDKYSRTLQQYVLCYAKRKDSLQPWVLMKGKNYTLILCDYRMPKMDGIELLKKIQKLKPELASRFLFITGSTEFMRDFDSFSKENSLACLLKPFTRDELIAAVNSVLRGSEK